MDIQTTMPSKILALPLGLYESVKLANARSKDGELFEIYAGLSEDMALQLKQKSLDAADRELSITSDRLRFGEGSYPEWYQRGRVPFALVHTATNQLAALAWFGSKPFGRKPMKLLTPEEAKQNERDLDNGNWHTIAYRAYPPFRGRGLMKGFVAFAMDVYGAQYPHVTFWEGVDADNPASIGLAEKLGFVIDKEASENDGKWLIMVRNAAR